VTWPTFHPLRKLLRKTVFFDARGWGGPSSQGRRGGGWVGGWARGTRTGRLTGRAGWERGGLGRIRGRFSARPSRERRGAELDLPVCEIFRLRDLTRSRVISPGVGRERSRGRKFVWVFTARRAQTLAAPRRGEGLGPLSYKKPHRSQPRDPSWPAPEAL